MKFCVTKIIITSDVYVIELPIVYVHHEYVSTKNVILGVYNTIWACVYTFIRNDLQNTQILPVAIGIYLLNVLKRWDVKNKSCHN